MDSARTSFVVPDPGLKLPPLDPDGLLPLFAAVAHRGTRLQLGENPWAMAQFADRAISPQWLDYPDPLRAPARRAPVPSGALVTLGCAMLGAWLLMAAGYVPGIGARAHDRPAPALSPTAAAPAAPVTGVAAPVSDVGPGFDTALAPSPTAERSAPFSPPEDAESCQAVQLTAATEPALASVEPLKQQRVRSPAKIQRKHRPARPLPARKRLRRS